MLPAASVPPESSIIAALQAEILALKEQLEPLKGQLEQLQAQVDWFKRQLFGEKSEKRHLLDTQSQADLLASLGKESAESTPPATETVSYERRKSGKSRDGAVTDAGLRFDDTVPVETIELPLPPESAAIPEEERVVIGEKVTHRLAQRPGSYVILRYIRPVIRQVDAGNAGIGVKLITAPAPANVLERSIADVSFLSGMLVDKCVYHLPLYRQHQRLAQCGITLSRTTLTTLAGQAIDLLSPIHDAQYRQLLGNRVLAMDETPIKAGRKARGKLRQGYFWPICGESDEVVFHYADSRASSHIRTILGERFEGVLLTDGYEAYARYAERHKAVVHAGCWAHTRRHFESAVKAEPEARRALDFIGLLYGHEERVRERKLAREEKLAYRTRHSLPVVKGLWRWCEDQCRRHDLVPTNPLSKALKYAMSRQAALQVFLSDPDVPMDTNQLERAIRPIAMGRKNWLFCWTELGAQRVAVIQSLLVTCRLQGIDPYMYLVDVLQRVSQHPAKDVIELTPRIWKNRFGDNPLTSDLASVNNALV